MQIEARSEIIKASNKYVGPKLIILERKRVYIVFERIGYVIEPLLALKEKLQIRIIEKHQNILKVYKWDADRLCCRIRPEFL